MSDPIHEMAAAFAIGCMDKENFIQFKDYMLAGGELPKKLLGEFQNISALIPSILDLETPDTKIKDDIAKKLISLKEEIRTKIREEKKKTTAAFEKSKTSFTKSFTPPQPNRAEKFTGIDEKAPGRLTAITLDNKKLSKATSPITDFETRKTGSTEEKSREKTKQEDIPPTLFPSRIATAERREKVHEKSSGFAGWIAIFLVLILFGVVGYFSYTSITDLQKQVADLKTDLTRTKNDLRATSEFTSKYMTIIEFLNYKDISVFDLVNTQPNISASAKIYLAVNQREVLLQLNNVPPLKPDETYQLWLVSKGRSYSLATFSPGPDDKFIRISNLPYIPLDQIDLFRITIEPAGGSQTPAGETYLSAALNVSESKTKK